MTADQLLRRLHDLGSERDHYGMTRSGINTDHALGVSMPKVRDLAKEVGRNHDLALELWASGVHEARIRACLIADPARVTTDLIDAWAADFDSWDLCDQVCGNLFDRTAHAWSKAVEWSGRDEEFVKRAGFSLIAGLAVHDKQAHDELFLQFLPIIEAEADDTRKFVTNAISWALRQIGKRNASLHKAAIETANYIAARASPTGRRLAREVLKELESAKVRARLGV